MDPQVKITTDGSSTIFIPELNEHYHSIHGAYQESLHVFIKSGLEEFHPTDNKITILEIGLGTGLNALLSADYAKNKKLYVNYVGIEPFPLGKNTIQKLHYDELSQVNIPSEWINKIAKATEFQKLISLHPTFTISVIKKPIEEVEFTTSFDLVYFDAFGPQAQPEIWSEVNFKKIFDVMSAGGIFTTYCSKGDVRRALKKVGFEIERIAGPPGKREMLRGRKI